MGITRPWKGNGIPRGQPGGRSGAGPGAHRPRLDRVTRRHARWYPPRVLEPEVMGTEDEAAAYMDAAALDHLARLDAGWAERVLAAGPRGPAQILDVGTGGGQIPALLATRRPDWRIWAVDRSRAMLIEGRESTTKTARAAQRTARPYRLALGQAEARALPFADGSIDLVVSNSLLHHLADPIPALDEITRIVQPAGLVLLRDLRRPTRLQFRSHVAWHGRHYAGAMRRLYEASVAAAFTVEELTILLRHTALGGATVVAHGPYLVIERVPTQVEGRVATGRAARGVPSAASR